MVSIGNLNGKSQPTPAGIGIEGARVVMLDKAQALTFLSEVIDQIKVFKDRLIPKYCGQSDLCAGNAAENRRQAIKVKQDVGMRTWNHG